eukprot:SAG31_NODE_14651_length_794_cov_1.775540_1_plen_155_part_10
MKMWRWSWSHPAVSVFLAAVQQLPVKSAETRHGCTCLPTTFCLETGKHFAGCGWPEHGWCDVKPGCVGSRDADLELDYHGWDTCEFDAAGDLPDVATVDAKILARNGSSSAAQVDPAAAGHESMHHMINLENKASKMPPASTQAAVVDLNNWQEA